MDIEDVVADLGAITSALPKGAMQWSLAHWDVAGPRFAAMLEAYVAGEDNSEASARALFFMLHLCAERREARIFPALCLLLLDADAPEAILGDGTTETLPRILVSTFDGDLAPLQAVVESATADMFVRDAALLALAYLTAAGTIADSRMRTYLLHLEATMQPRKGDFIWHSWVKVVALLAYSDFVPRVERLFADRFVPREVTRASDFKQLLAATLADPTRLAGFEHEHVRPIADAIGTLSTWVWDDEETDALPPTMTNPFKDVGRNDSCPCGSGKKFKKCCLGSNPFA